MKPSERRAQMKEQAQERLRETYNSKDDSGKYKSIIVKAAQGNIPSWKCGEGEHFIDIVPFFAGKNNPNAKEGKLVYCLDVWEHRKVGVNEDSYICLQRTYQRPCPICEEQARIRAEENYDEKFVKSLNPTRRAIYNIICRDNNQEERKGVQLFNVSHWLFEKEILEISKKPRGGGFVEFFDPDDGKTVFFRKSGSTATNTEYKAFKFEDRQEPVTDDQLDAALVLDEIIHIPTYTEVKNAFFGFEESDDIPEREIEERRVEATTRQPSSPPPFKCPGDRPGDFGTFDACEHCPEVAACEAEFDASGAGVAGKEEPPFTPDPPPAPRQDETPVETGRRLRSQAAAPAAAPAAQPAAQPAAGEEGGRRIRRRVGGE